MRYGVHRDAVVPASVDFFTTLRQPRIPLPRNVPISMVKHRRARNVAGAETA